MQAMGALITTEADTMSAMRYRMGQAGKAMRMGMKFDKAKGISERRKPETYLQLVQALVLNANEKLELDKRAGRCCPWVGKQEVGDHKSKNVEKQKKQYPGASSNQSSSLRKDKIEGKWRRGN